MRTALVSLGVLLLATPSLRGQSTGAPSPETLQWGPAPAVFPKGARMAVVSGDPSKAEKFVVELSFPAGYRIPPHFHPTEELVQVVKGLFLVGMGDTFDLSQTKAMTPGEKGALPENMHHFAAAKVATVVSITSMGPFAMTYVNQADNPQISPAKP